MAGQELEKGPGIPLETSGNTREHLINVLVRVTVHQKAHLYLPVNN